MIDTFVRPSAGALAMLPMGEATAVHNQEPLGLLATFFAAPSIIPRPQFSNKSTLCALVAASVWSNIASRIENKETSNARK